MKYIVRLGPDEADEYTAHKAVEQSDGSLQWIDTAGVPHVAPPGSWFRQPIHS